MAYHFKFLLFFIGYTLFSISLYAQNNYHYSYIPKAVYENQLFPVTIMGLDNYPSFSFDSNTEVAPIFKKPLMVNNGRHTFYTFYFKAIQANMHLPLLHITSNQHTITLDSQDISIKTLPKNKNFSSVLAADMKIIEQQVSNYNEKYHMVTLLLEAYEANIEDMFLVNVQESGIENIKRKHAKVTAKLYAIIPREESQLVFSYFNTVKERFITLSVPVKVSDSSVTTQSDLNPKVDVFEQLKRYALIAFMLFFISMFLWKRDFLYLMLAILSFIALLTFYIPSKKVCIKQDTALYLLPTETSTISTRINKDNESILLGRHNNYIKIAYKKEIIGWIKNEDTCEN